MKWQGCLCRFICIWIWHYALYCRISYLDNVLIGGAHDWILYLQKSILVHNNKLNCLLLWIHNFPHISSKLKQKRVKRLSHRRLQCWQKGNRTTILPPANLDPSPNRIRLALKVWFNQFPFTSCSVHGSLCLHCIPLLECKHTMNGLNGNEGRIDASRIV